MKHLGTVSVAPLLASLALGSAVASDGGQVSPAPAVVFFDDFSGPDVNRTHWNVIITGRVVNNEQQAYVDSPDTLQIVHGAEADGAENALAIRPLFRSGFRTADGRSFDFISGRLESRGKAEFTHGTVAARIKLPAGGAGWTFRLTVTNSAGASNADDVSIRAPK